MTCRWFWKPKSIILTSLVLPLALLVACVSAAQPPSEEQDSVKDTPKEVVTKKQPPKESVTEKQVPKMSLTEKVDSKADIVPAAVPPNLAPRAVPRPAEAPAVALPQGKRGGFINMNDYADVRQRLIAQAGWHSLRLQFDWLQRFC